MDLYKDYLMHSASGRHVNKPGYTKQPRSNQRGSGNYRTKRQNRQAANARAAQARRDRGADNRNWHTANEGKPTVERSNVSTYSVESEPRMPNNRRWWDVCATADKSGQYIIMKTPYGETEAAPASYWLELFSTGEDASQYRYVGMENP